RGRSRCRGGRRAFAESFTTPAPAQSASARPLAWTRLPHSYCLIVPKGNALFQAPGRRRPQRVLTARGSWDIVSGTFQMEPSNSGKGRRRSGVGPRSVEGGVMETVGGAGSARAGQGLFTRQASGLVRELGIPAATGIA